MTVDRSVPRKTDYRFEDNAVLGSQEKQKLTTGTHPSKGAAERGDVVPTRLQASSSWHAVMSEMQQEASIY